MDTTTVPNDARPDTREEKALAMYRAHRRNIVLIDRDVYECPSEDGLRVYEVRYGGDVDEGCTCPAATYRPEVSCKHLIAVAVCRAKRRGDTARRLAALEARYRKEILEDDERCEIRDTIAKLRAKMGGAG